MSKDYAALARNKIFIPGDTEQPYHLFVYGRNKKGKTTFASSPGPGKVLVMDPEAGTARMTTSKTHVWPVKSWQDVEDSLNYARTGKHDYQWFAYDGMTKIAQMCLRTITGAKAAASLADTRYQARIQDYGTLRDIITEFLDQLHALPYGIILTAQEKQKESGGSGDEDEDADERDVQYVPDLTNGVKGAINSWADCIGRIYTVRVPVKVRTKEGIVEERERMQRRLYLAPHVAYDTGYRSDFRNIPDYLTNPTVDRLVSLLSTGKAA